MSRYIKFLAIIFFSFSIQALANNHELIVDEVIGESVRLRILNSDNNDVDILVSVTGVSFSTPFLLSLEQHSLQQGLDYSFQSVNSKSFLSFTVDREHIDDLFRFLKTKSNELQNAKNVEILILGNVNQQKILGRLYSQWGKFSAKSNPDFSYIDTFTPDDKKNKKLLWTKVLAAYLICEKDDRSTIDFYLRENSIQCNHQSIKRQLTPGEIANIKSSLYSRLQSDREDHYNLLQLLTNFQLHNSVTILDEFIATLPELSIEAIHSLYLENIKSFQAAMDSSILEDKPAVLDDYNSSLIKFFPSEKSIWALNFVFDEEFEICSYVNCPKVSSQLLMEHYYSDKTWLFLIFHKNDIEKQIKFIAEEIVKPLNIKGNFTDPQTQVMSFGPSSNIELLPIMKAANIDLSLIQLTRFTSNTINVNKTKCELANGIGSPFWASQILQNYGNKYLDNKKGISNISSSRGLFKLICQGNSKFENNVLLKEEFSSLKQALMSKIKRLDEKDYSYQTFANYYKFDPKAQLLEQLDLLNYQEYQYLYGSKTVESK